MVKDSAAAEAATPWSEGVLPLALLVPLPLLLVALLLLVLPLLLSEAGGPEATAASCTTDAPPVELFASVCSCNEQHLSGENVDHQVLPPLQNRPLLYRGSWA